MRNCTFMRDVYRLHTSSCMCVGLIDRRRGRHCLYDNHSVAAFPTLQRVRQVISYTPADSFQLLDLPNICLDSREAMDIWHGLFRFDFRWRCTSDFLRTSRESRILQWRACQPVRQQVCTLYMYSWKAYTFISSLYLTEAIGCFCIWVEHYRPTSLFTECW